MPVEEFDVIKQRLTSSSVFYAEAAASNSPPEVRHDNVYLISGPATAGSPNSAAVAVNDAVLASISSFLRDVLMIHQKLPEPPEDR